MVASDWLAKYGKYHMRHQKNQNAYLHAPTILESEKTLGTKIQTR